MKNRIKDIYNEIEDIISDNPKLDNMINERIEWDNRTIEQVVKESGIDYQISGGRILIGKPLEDYDSVKEMELERALEQEYELREDQAYRWGEGCEEDRD